jgi:hypothetical protein
VYIRKSTRTYKGKSYTNYLLVESIQTPKGPRQRIICSLGSLEPGPAEEWLALAHKLESALQGQESLPESSAQIQGWVEKARRKRAGKTASADENGSGSAIAVDAGKIEMEHAREAGPVHVGHQLWEQLGLNRILQEAGLSQRACTLTEAMTLNRLICPRSEHAMPDWIRRTALGDILKQDFSKLQDEALYRNLDRLHPNREHIERTLAEKEKTLFNLDDTVYLYDLTSTYFEGQAKANPHKPSEDIPATSGPTANRSSSDWCWIVTGFPKRTKSSTAICKTAAVWTRCWMHWKSAPASGQARR